MAFKLAQALLESTAADEAERTRLREKTLPSFLKLLAIATIADAVPLTGENRAIASLGLVELRKPSQAGLRALMELAQIDTRAADLGDGCGVSAGAADQCGGTDGYCFGCGGDVFDAGRGGGAGAGGEAASAE